MDKNTIYFYYKNLKKMTGGSMDITRVKNPGFFSIEKVIYRKIGLANSNAQLIGAWFTWI